MRTTNLIVLDGKQRHWTLGCSMYLRWNNNCNYNAYSTHGNFRGIRDNREYNTVRVYNTVSDTMVI